MRAQGSIECALIRMNKRTFYAHLRAGDKMNRCNKRRKEEKRLALRALLH